MWTTKQIKAPKGFNFRLAALGHGWYDLPPFSFDEANGTLSYVFAEGLGKTAVHATISENKGKIQIELDRPASDADLIIDQVRHILRLDEPFTDFHEIVARHGELNWVAVTGAGRLLRSPTVFEDAVKTLCTTNCSWSLTRSMIDRLVSELGIPSKTGGKSFPTPAAMAVKDEPFFRDRIRAGYRAPYFVEFARSVVRGTIDPESWLDPNMPTAELRKEILSIKGFGKYAVDNLMKLLGRYDGLALDSWLRSQFYKKYNRGKECPDKKIEKQYKEFGEWKGLAIWCDMTKDWHIED